MLDGFIAFTEIKLKFYNPENRQREGRFRITLPDNAHLARFAMQIDGRWQEGEVVEKKKQFGHMKIFFIENKIRHFLNRMQAMNSVRESFLFLPKGIRI